MFIRINPEEQSFNGLKAINRISRHIKKSPKNSIERSTKKSLIDDLSKRLLELEFKSDHSIKSKCLKFIVKNIAVIIKHANCKSCKKHTGNIGSKEVTMRNKVIREKSRCANCMSDKSRFLKQKSNKRSDWKKY